MYEIQYSDFYVIVAVFNLLINVCVIFKLRGGAKARHEDEIWLRKMLYAGSISTISDAACVYFTGNIGRTLFFAMNAVFFISYSYTIMLFALYMVQKYFREKLTSPVTRILFHVPIVSVIIMIIVSYWNGCAFSVDKNGLYSRGPLFGVMYAFGAMYAVAIVVMAFIVLFSKIKNRETAIAPVIWVAPSIVGSLLQLLAADLPCSSMGLLCTFLLMTYGSQDISNRENLEAKDIENAKIFRAICEEYYNVYLIDMKTLKTKIIKMNGYVVSIIDEKKKKEYDYNALVKAYIGERVVKEEVAEVSEKLSVENVLRQTERNGKYEDVYHINDGRDIQNIKFKYQKLEDTELYVASFQNIDDVLENEKDYQNKLKKALDDAEHANNSKTVFLNNMSHDIRTPMNAIIGFTNLAKAHIDEREQVKDYLDKIQVSSEHLLSLINDVLDMSRIESGKITLENSRISMKGLVSELVSILQPSVKSRNLQMNIDTNLENDMFFGDKLRLNQILINILGNAAKFTQPGGQIDFSISQTIAGSDGEAIYKFVIRDNGIGMSKEFAAHIFEPFTREKTSTVSGIQGSGLGMAITGQLVEMMGGFIKVESELNVGSEFTVTLPLKIVSDEDNKKISEKSPDITRDFSGRRLLLVEDNELNQEIATAVLEEAGFKVDVVGDGEVAVRRMSGSTADRYDAILMDIQMPKMDGYEATRQIRALPDERMKTIPIIAMTANAFEEDKKMAFEAGMNAHVAKPIVPEALLGTLSEFMN